MLTDEERRTLLGIPSDPDDMARLFTLTRADQGLVTAHRGDANRLGAAVQLALLRHPGTTLANLDQQSEPLVTWLDGQLRIPAVMFAQYARRPQTMTDHARQLAAALALRSPTAADRPVMIVGRRAGGLGDRPWPADRRGRDRTRRHCRTRAGTSACY